MRMFITSENKYLLNDMKIFGTCSIPLIYILYELSGHNVTFPFTCSIIRQKFYIKFNLLLNALTFSLLVNHILNMASCITL